MVKTTSTSRPDPDALLESITKRSKQTRAGRLYLFIGMAPGVGKTYAMLMAAQEAKQSNVDVIVGVVESHGRQETESLLDGLERIPKIKHAYREIMIEEMDLDAILTRKPKLVLVDELAHSNAPGSRHLKRWQDVEEILNAGIDVFSTLNVQHLESRKEAIEQITGITIRESVPDSMIDRAFQIRLIDLSVPDLLKRLKEGKVYLGEKADLAASNFFREEKLTALREIALRLAAEKVDQDLQSFATEREASEAWPASERLMVAVTAHADSAKLLRVARRLAYNLEAQWIALHVDTGKILSEEEKTRLAKVLEIARRLGAEVMMTTDTSVAEGLLRIARQRDVTQIIVGNAKRSPFFEFFAGASLLDQLLAKGNFDIHVVNKETGNRFSWRNVFSLFQRYAPLSAYLRSLWLLLGLGVLSSLAVNIIGYRAVGFVFLLAILAFGFFNSLGPVLFIATLSALTWNYFFIPPTYTFYIGEAEDVFMVLSYFLTALVTGILARQISFQKRFLVRREERTDWLYRLVWELASTPSKERMIASAVDKVADFFGGYCDVALARKDKALRDFNMNRLMLSNPKREIAVAKWAFDNRKPAGWGTETLSAAEALYIPLTIDAGSIGVMAFKPKPDLVLAPEDTELLFAVARQITVCLERESFREKAFETFRLEETQNLHRGIIDLFSSDARSQLSIIAQGSSVISERIAEHGDLKSKQVSEQLLDATEKLTLMFDNFVTMSRLSVGIFPINAEQISVKELLAFAVNRLTRVLAHRRLVVDIPSDLPNLTLDARLCQQVLVNVLVNAAFNSNDESRIWVTATRHDQMIQISICDEGEGVPGDELQRIFEKFYRLESSKSDGVGLGLTVARGVIRAHNGKIRAEHGKDGKGLCIIIDLPAQR